MSASTSALTCPSETVSSVAMGAPTIPSASAHQPGERARPIASTSRSGSDAQARQLSANQALSAVQGDIADHGRNSTASSGV